MDILNSSLSCTPKGGVLAFGIKETIQGPIEIGEGNFRKGLNKTLIGLTATNLGSRWMGFGGGLHQELMKYSLCLGTAAVGVRGFCNFANGIKNRSKFQVVEGIAQAAMGLAATVYLDSLSSKVLLVAQQTFLLVMTSCWISKSGLSDLTQRQYKKGVYKILLGMSGIGCAGYYVYSELFFKNYGWRSEPLTPDEMGFIKNHTSEIEELYTHQKPVGQWRKIGSGVSKAAYQHPQLPGYLIKVPTNADSYWYHRDNDAETHYKILQNIQAQFKQADFPHIVLPNCHLVNTTKGTLVVEQMFDTTPYFSVPDSQQKHVAETELRRFLEKNNICDIHISADHNAGIIKGTERDPKIGIYDFDCNSPDSNKADTIQQDRVKGVAFAISSAVMATSVQMTRKISGIKLARVSMALGALAGVGTIIYFNSVVPASKFEIPKNEALFLIGGLSAAFTTAMGLTAICSWKILLWDE